MTNLRRLLPLLSALLLVVLTGCAERDDSDSTSSAEDGDFPVVLNPQGAAEVTLESRPERIVSLSPATTETLFAVGAGDQVVAVDDQSNYPEQAPQTDLSGLNADAEAIASHDPDLVIVESDQDNELTDALAKLDITTLVLPAPETIEDAYAQFEFVGEATGHRDAGVDLAETTKNDIEKLVADAPESAAELSYYHELDPSLYSVTSATFIGEVYSLFGLTNIADQDDPEAFGGYPQLSAERILEADPDLIFLADSRCCGQDAETVADRSGWEALTAVQQDQVFQIDDDIASRWSPRLVDFVETVAGAVADAEA